MIVLERMGETPKAISKQLGRSHHTVGRYLDMKELLNDPEVQELIAFYDNKAKEQLKLIIGFARTHIFHKLLEGKVRPIEAVAIMDRSFQQLRLLEGQSTSNIAFKDVVKKLVSEIRVLEADVRDLSEDGKGGEG